MSVSVCRGCGESTWIQDLLHQKHVCKTKHMVWDLDNDDAQDAVEIYTDGGAHDAAEIWANRRCLEDMVACEYNVAVVRPDGKEEHFTVVPLVEISYKASYLCDKVDVLAHVDDEDGEDDEG